MLRVKGFVRPGEGAFDAPAGQLLVLNHHGDPVVVVVEHGGVPMVSVAGDDDFEDVARAAGYKVQVVAAGGK